MVVFVVAAASAATDPPLSQDEVRRLIEVVDDVQASRLVPTPYNPLDMVSAVNSLQPLDKGQALRVLHNCPPGDGKIAVARFLFECAQLHAPLYTPFDEYTTEATPSFPAVVIHGVPLYLSPMGGFGGTGNFPSSLEDLDWYREHGTMRGDALRPHDDPRVVWQTWLQSELRERIANSRLKRLDEADRHVQEQLLRMIETIHPREFDEDTLHREDVAALWSRAIETLDRTPTRWDVSRNIYVRAADGSFLEPVAEPEYRSVGWSVPMQGRFASFKAKRVSEEVVHLRVRQQCNDSPPLADMTLRVEAADDPTREIAVFEIDGSFVNGSWGSVSEVRLEKSVALRAVLLQDGRVIARSSAMSPDREVGQ
jgi:hypothetical protein